MNNKRPCSLCHGTNYPSKFTDCPLCRDDDDETEDDTEKTEMEDLTDE